ncbi:MAG: ATP-binding protein, partial [Synechococcales bacterium]|nr:ATP-binding protein [Synechococcales bacterium]
MVEVSALDKALQYLSQVIQWRLESYFADTTAPNQALPIPPDSWLTPDTALTHFIETHQLNIFEQLALLIAL